MTAEIVVLNKQAVALAADSAVTLGRGEKIFSSANKIFTLSKFNPVGVMIYGNAEFLQVPWEVVIKAYRRELRGNQFPVVIDYAEDFLRFLRASTSLFPPAEQDRHLSLSVRGYFHTIKHEVSAILTDMIEQGQPVTDTIARRVSRTVIDAHHKAWLGAEFVEGASTATEDAMVTKHAARFKQIRETTFQKLPLTRGSKEKLAQIAALIQTRVPSHTEAPTTTGIVFAGYGEEEHYPAVVDYNINGMADGLLHFTQNKHLRVGVDIASGVVPFAQSEMVAMFMEGVDPQYKASMDEQLAVLLAKYSDTIVDAMPLSQAIRDVLKPQLRSLGSQLLNRYNATADEQRRRDYTKPVTDIVSSLPKDELAAMAESLVNLTSFKRRVSRQVESVGGPIDVAVISKGDGFVWIQRKHYFKPDLNPHFFSNYFRGV